MRLVDADAQLAKAVYTITNPVAALLVTEHHYWPGLISLPARMGRPQAFKRPRGFFRDKGPLPAHAVLSVDPLPAFAHLA
ncbi:MAG: hypothetical protein IPL40_11935 [Proteobacteria bacterium]|nr:hypothetical protein [Pseudomonadota bacterium]